MVSQSLIPLSNPAVLGGRGKGLLDARTKCPPELTKLMVGGLIPLGIWGLYHDLATDLAPGPRGTFFPLGLFPSSLIIMLAAFQILYRFMLS